ncbi:MAG: kelch repeat-containing protein [Candidatus Eisenbacteria bacterium]
MSWPTKAALRALLVVLLVVCTGVLTSARAQSNDLPALTAEQRAAIAAAADAPGLASWQRELMQRLGGASATNAADGRWDAAYPPGRCGATMTYDPVRNRLVLFGGRDAWSQGDLWTLTLAGTPAWSRIRPAGVAPSARSAHSAIYDPVRDRLLVFGGGGALGATADVWALTLGPTAAWTPIVPVGTPPSPRAGQSAVYDPVRDRMIVFGGNTSNETWALSLAGTPAWTLLSPTGTPPAGRNSHAAIYDPLRDRLLVYGGYSNTYLGDCWALSLAGTPAWSPLATTGAGPGLRTNACGLYDPVRDAMLVIGGDGQAAGMRNDVYSLALAGTPTWSLLATTGTPFSPRMWPAAAYVPGQDRLIVATGLGAGTNGGYLTDGASLAFATLEWSALTPLTQPPAGRTGMSVIYDSDGRRLVVFGGYDRSSHAAGGTCFNDTWTLALDGTPRWTLLAPTGTLPLARRGHSAVYDSPNKRMVIFGGVTAAGTYRNDVMALTLGATPAWSTLTGFGTPPSARAEHVAIFDPYHDRMVVHGGRNASTTFSDMREFSLFGAASWNVISPGGSVPAARSGHSVLLDASRGRMVIMGGLGAAAYDDLWAFDLLNTREWANVTPSGTSPGARVFHSTVYDAANDRMLLFGGEKNGVMQSELWSLPLAAGGTWTLLAPEDPPLPRSEHAAIYDPVNARMLSFGGVLDYARNDLLLFGSIPAGTLGVGGAVERTGLRAAAPNPFVSVTTLRWTQSRAGRTRLAVFDAQGRRVRALLDETRLAGAGRAEWDGADEDGTSVGPGVYFVTLEYPGARETRRVLRLR